MFVPATTGFGLPALSIEIDALCAKTAVQTNNEDRKTARKMGDIIGASVPQVAEAVDDAGGVLAISWWHRDRIRTTLW